MFLLVAVPILVVSIIIILAMNKKQKVLFEHFYLLAEHEKYPGFAYASIQNADDATIEFAKMKKDLLALATVAYSGIYGVGLKVNKPEDIAKDPSLEPIEVAGGYNLSTDVPVIMSIPDAIKLLEEFKNKHSLNIHMGAGKPI